jgi:probable HAF family extracellular repeat protein
MRRIAATARNNQKKSAVLQRLFDGGSVTLASINPLEVGGNVRLRVRQCIGAAAGVACLSAALAGCGGAGSAFTPGYDRSSERVATNTRFIIRDLGVVGQNANQPGQPLVISNNGWISGAAGVGSAEHAVLWHGKKRMDIGSPGLGGNSFGYGVNDVGHAAGDAELISKKLSTTEDFCGWEAMGFSSSPTPCVPFVWQNGKMAALERIGGVNGVATQINNDGVVAGYAENDTLDPRCPAPQLYEFKPVVWSHGRARALSTGSDREGVALAINNGGGVVGSSGTCAAFNPVWLWNFQPVHALLWQNGVATDLGNLGGSLNNFAHDVNNRDEVVGSSDLSGDQTSHAFLWTSAEKMRDLGTVRDKIDHDTYSVGLGINDAGQIVGVSANASFSVVRAFVRQNGALVDLNGLVSGSTKLHLMTACSINDSGQIIGIAIDSSGQLHGYLASPATRN